MKNIKAVIFDLDDTLVNRNLAFKNYSRSFISEHFNDTQLPDKIDSMIEYMVLLDNNGHCNKYDFYGTLIEKWQMKDCTAEQFRNDYKNKFYMFTTPDTDMQVVLDYLKPKYKLGIISNGSSKAQNDKIDYIKVRNQFDSIIVSDDVGVQKPDKQIYMLSCVSLEVKPDEAVFVGDYYKKDIIGAKGAGLHAIWYPNASDKLHSYEYTIKRLSELLNIL